MWFYGKKQPASFPFPSEPLWGIYSRVPTRELCSWNLEGHRPMYVFTDLSSICDHESNQQVVQGLHWKS